jgi:hypothetical protein
LRTGLDSNKVLFLWKFIVLKDIPDPEIINGISEIEIIVNQKSK